MAEKTSYKRRTIDSDDDVHRGAMVEAANADNAVFGEGLLEEATQIVHKHQDRDDFQAFEDELWELVRPTAMIFAEKLRMSGRVNAAFAGLLSRAGMVPDIARFLNEHDELFEAGNFAAALEKREVPADIFLSILAFHIRQMEAARGRLEQLIGPWKLEFLNAARKAVEEGFLSKKTDIALIEQRLNDLSVIGIDPFLTGEHDAGGTYNAFLVRINLYSPTRDQRHSFFHEGAHGVISGRQELAERFDSHEQYGVRKSGLSLFSYRGKRGEYDRRLGWMDEAVSEEVAGYLSGDGPRSYPDERELLAELKNEGLSHAVIMDAYQENWPSEATSGTTRLPAMRALYRELNAQLPKGWLADQDAAFERKIREYALGN